MCLLEGRQPAGIGAPKADEEPLSKVDRQEGAIDFDRRKPSTRHFRLQASPADPKTPEPFAGQANHDNHEGDMIQGETSATLHEGWLT